MDNKSKIFDIVLGGLFTLTAVILKWYLDAHPFLKTKSRAATLSRNIFFGDIIQNGCIYKGKLELKVLSKHRIKGIFKITYNEYQNHPGTVQTMNMTGSYNFDQFLNLEYKNANSSNKQLGVIFLEYLSDGVTLEGYFVGYGPVSNKVQDCREASV